MQYEVSKLEECNGASYHLWLVLSTSDTTTLNYRLWKMEEFESKT